MDRVLQRAILLPFLFLTLVGKPDAASPNVLIITADNLGYGDLQCYNADSNVRTPNLDQLAAQGARLTSFYTASSTCTVSRACLLTGRIAQRHRLVNQLPGVDGNYGVGLNQNEILIPAILKSVKTPYATGCFGKWNIGFAKGSRPTERGFDEFIGHVSGNIDYYRHNYRQMHDLYDGVRELHRQGEYSTDIFADACIEFITRETEAKQPWFAYLPFNAPHFPMKGNKQPGQPTRWQAPDWAFEPYGWSPEEEDPYRRFCAVVFALDRAIGRVLKALDDAGASDNTFVFFMSDNGAFMLGRRGLDVGSNHPLRSGGITCWEGGIRIPAIARWPTRIKPGIVIDQPLWSPDLSVTTAAIAGAELPGNVVFDGKDITAVLCDGAKSPHESFYFSFRSHSAVRKGDWKIVRENPGEKWKLFNLAEDVAESSDLAKERPKKLHELTSIFDSWNDSF